MKDVLSLAHTHSGPPFSKPCIPMNTVNIGTNSFLILGTILASLRFFMHPNMHLLPVHQCTQQYTGSTQSMHLISRLVLKHAILLQYLAWLQGCWHDV